MSWLRNNQRSAIVCGLTLLIPLLLYFKVLIGLLETRQTYQSEIDRLVPRIARLLGLKEQEALLDRLSIEAGELEETLVYPASSTGAAIAANLQNDVKQLLKDAGLSVSNSQVLPKIEGQNFDHIAIKLTVTGNLVSLNNALTAISNYSPLVIVEALDVWPDQVRRGQAPFQTVTASVQLMSMRSVL